MAANSGLKVEGNDGTPGLLNVKAEPHSAVASPAVQSEDDVYEDAGDLDFTDAGQNLWLCRLPKYLWQKWAKLDGDEPIQIGTMRVEHGADQQFKRVTAPRPSVLRRRGLLSMELR